MKYKAGSIYILPNGRELMASGDGTSFYAASDDGQVIWYELNDAGRLLFQGRLTAWSVEDLRDSGQIVETPLAAPSSTRSESTSHQ